MFSLWSWRFIAIFLRRQLGLNIIAQVIAQVMWIMPDISQKLKL